MEKNHILILFILALSVLLNAGLKSERKGTDGLTLTGGKLMQNR